MRSGFCKGLGAIGIKAEEMNSSAFSLPIRLSRAIIKHNYINYMQGRIYI
jgi:hypothetical protein